MIRRFRFATALVALITLSAFSAEGVAALVFCEPAGAAQQSDSSDHSSHPDHGDTASQPDDSGSTHENHCPIGMAGSGSCAVASVPAGPALMQDAPTTRDAAWLVCVESLRSASIHPLLRPPRA